MSTIVFLSPPSHTHRTAEENIGIGYLVACLRSSGHSVTVVDGWLEGLSVEEIFERVNRVDQSVFIGISCYRYSLDDVSAIITKLREQGQGAPIVAGGFGPTYHDEDFLRIGVDYVVRGEGEEAVIALADMLGSLQFNPETINGLSWLGPDMEVRRSTKLSGIATLDSIPFPSRDTIATAISLKNPVHIVTSRGCLANCLFCSVVSFRRQMKETARWRQRSIGNIIDEIRELYERYGVTCFKIVDDSFIEPPRDEHWVNRFANELQRFNLSIRFRTQIRADRLHEPLVQALRAAGWFATSVGIENGSQTALKRMNKSATLNDNLRAVELLKAYGVYAQMGMILFDHETSFDELRENAVFMRSLDWVVTKGIFTEMYASQGTPFTAMLRKAGRIVSDQNGNFVYEHADERVRCVYVALKQWHRSHSTVYDHAINPISAPKVLPMEGYVAYHAICRRLYDLDVQFFDQAMTLADAGITADDVNEWVTAQVTRSENIFGGVLHELRTLDQACGLRYDAEPNPFL